jgi:hypothetical protein
MCWLETRFLRSLKAFLAWGLFVFPADIVSWYVVFAKSVARWKKVLRAHFVCRRGALFTPEGAPLKFRFREIARIYGFAWNFAKFHEITRHCAKLHEITWNYVEFREAEGDGFLYELNRLGVAYLWGNSCP